MRPCPSSEGGASGLMSSQRRSAMQIVGTVLGILFLSVVMVALAVLAFGPFVLDELADRKKRAGKAAR